MSFFDQFMPAPLPVGAIIEAGYNLGATDPSWVPCNGQRLTRATYPVLANQVPNLGVFDPTSRTKASAPTTASGVASNGTIWVMGAAAGTTGIQTTPDGVTFTHRATQASCQPSAIIWTGTRFVHANLAAVPAQNSTDGTTWNVGTGAPSLAALYPNSMAYDPTGQRLAMVCANNNVYTSTDHGQNWTTTGNGLSLSAREIVWTGNTFFATINYSPNAFTTANGTSGFAAVRLPQSVSNNGFCGLCSDGAGKILAFLINYSTASNMGLYLSKDHGQTWQQVLLPNFGAAPVAPTLISFTNNRWFIPVAMGVYISADGEFWNYIPDARMLSTDYASTNAAICFRSSGTYMNASGVSANAVTWVEDTAKFYAPQQGQQASYVGNARQQWIKAY